MALGAEGRRPIQRVWAATNLPATEEQLHQWLRHPITAMQPDDGWPTKETRPPYTSSTLLPRKSCVCALSLLVLPLLLLSLSKHRQGSPNQTRFDIAFVTAMGARSFPLLTPTITSLLPLRAYMDGKTSRLEGVRTSGLRIPEIGRTILCSSRMATRLDSMLPA